MNSICKRKKAQLSLAVWGLPGVPLLPETLRLAWADEPLPEWVLKETSLPAGSTLASLDAGVWAYPLKGFTPRLRSFLVNLVRSRQSEIEPLPVFVQTWPASLSPVQLPWSTRTRNCLTNSGLIDDRAALSRVTYKDLFMIPAMGVISVLEFAATAEGAMHQLSLALDRANSQSHQDAFHRDFQDRLVAVVNAHWAHQISEQDPRFAHLLPPGEGTIFERIDDLTSSPRDDYLIVAQVLTQAISAVEDRIRELECLSLDIALKDFLFALSGYSGRKLEAMLARLGWEGSAPISLETAGHIVGVSRERIRQLQKQIEGRIPSHPVFMPALDKAINILIERAPLDPEQAAHLLVAEGIASKSFGPQSVCSVANACGRNIPFAIEEHRGRSRIVTKSHAKHANNIISIAYRQAGASGATNIAEVTAEATSHNMEITEKEVREILQLFSEVQFLEDEWFWYPKLKENRNRLRNISRKMLAVVSPMSVATIRDGLRREYFFRGVRSSSAWPLTVPPRSVLRTLFRVHPEFNINDHDQVTPLAPLDYRMELPETEQIFVDVFRASPACVLDRTSCAKGCIERGMNQNTFSIYLTYSAIVAHLGTDIWTLRGVQVDPAAVEALRAANAEQPREKRVLDHGWTPDGRPWVAVRLPDAQRLGSFVFGLPAQIRRLVADSEFCAYSENNVPSGRVRISEDGASWGYSPFLARSGADEDDVLIVEFDLVERNAILRLGDDEILEELNP